MAKLHRRLHVRIDEERLGRVRRLAELRRVPIAAVVREAIDRLLTASEARAAATGLLGAPEMPVADWAQMKAELLRKSFDGR